jgi:hypothetical protein
MGHPLGNDFDRVSVAAVEHLGSSLDLEISAEHVRKGEGRITEPYPEDRFDDSYFLTGVVERSAGVSIGVRYFVDPLWTVELAGGVAHIWNHEHLEGASHTQPSVRLKLEKMFR